MTRLFKVGLAFDIARHVGTPGRSVLIFVSGIAQITDFVDRFNEIKERGRGRNQRRDELLDRIGYQADRGDRIDDAV